MECLQAMFANNSFADAAGGAGHIYAPEETAMR